jgi:AcrR family transcriptional regulator
LASPARRLRKIPQQTRGQRRVAGLLDAAESVLAESGYEAATMSAVAGRAGASIGSLYQFFPNKAAVAEALRHRYAQEYDELCAPLEARASALNLHELVQHLMSLNIGFVESHPAFVALLDAPHSSRIPAALRTRLRDRFAGFFLARKPRMSKEKAGEIAVVTLHILKGLNQLYAETPGARKDRFVAEFKTVLTGYLGSRMGLQS